MYLSQSNTSKVYLLIEHLLKERLLNKYWLKIFISLGIFLFSINVQSNQPDYCTNAAIDRTGEGWGWDKDHSCLVRNGLADPNRKNFHGCVVGVQSFPYCKKETGGWGFEEGKLCIASSFCPSNRSMVAQQTPISDSPVDKKASATTKKIYAYLKSIWGQKTLSGQQDLTWKDETNMSQRVKNDTGKAPAIMGFDFMQYTRPGNGSGHTQTAKALAYWQQGGLISFCWHWRDPSHETDQFYSEKMNFQIPIINGKLDETSKSFRQMETDLDLIAGELKKLQTQGVTLFWRPLHEASGGWFWWGRTRTDDVAPAYAYVLLWQHIYHRLVNHHGLHNLIWVWNGQNAAWYPGDNFVDIVGNDIYDGAKNYASQIKSYNSLVNSSTQRKLIALTENSNIPDPDEMKRDGAHWLWFMTWNDGASEEGLTDKDNYWTGDYYNTHDHKIKVYSHPNIITLDELPRFHD